VFWELHGAKSGFDCGWADAGGFEAEEGVSRFEAEEEGDLGGVGRQQDHTYMYTYNRHGGESKDDHSFLNMYWRVVNSSLVLQ
jgi:hypothetical protein